MGIIRLLYFQIDRIVELIIKFENSNLYKEYEKMFIQDPNTKKPSVTTTAFVLGFVIACIKLLLSGMEIGSHVKFSDFSGTDFSMIMAALGAIYALRKHATKNDDKQENKGA